MDPGNQRQLVPHHHQYSISPLSIDASRGDMIPPWGNQEIRDFLIIRAELDLNFMETKRTKLLWEVISTRMKEKGYTRSADQCKCKWTNLVTRFKGCETMEAGGMRQQFLFYNELKTICTARMKRMSCLEADGGGANGTESSSKKKAMASSYQFLSDEEVEIKERVEEKVSASAAKKKRKLKGTMNVPAPAPAPAVSANTLVLSGIKEMMDEFMRQQVIIEMQWMQAFEKREEERKVKEMEWRKTMEALENERLMMERKWRERDEQRKIKEEVRAEKRDALIATLMDKLKREDNM